MEMATNPPAVDCSCITYPVLDSRSICQMPYFKPFPVADESDLSPFEGRARTIVRRCTRTAHLQASIFGYLQSLLQFQLADAEWSRLHAEVFSANAFASAAFQVRRNCFDAFAPEAIPSNP